MPPIPLCRHRNDHDVQNLGGILWALQRDLSLQPRVAAALRIVDATKAMEEKQDRMRPRGCPVWRQKYQVRRTIGCNQRFGHVTDHHPRRHCGRALARAHHSHLCVPLAAPLARGTDCTHVPPVGPFPLVLYLSHWMDGGISAPHREIAPIKGYTHTLKGI